MTEQTVTSSGVQDLINRLRDDGVNAGQQQASNIVNKAKDQAAKILADAKKQSQQMLDAASGD